TGRDITRVVQLDELAQERLGVLLLNRLHAGHGRGIDTLPIGDEAFAVTRALAVLALPAGLANIGAPKIGFLIEQQRVIRLPVGKRLAAGGASVGARLDVPLGHIAVTAAAGGTSPAVRRHINSLAIIGVCRDASIRQNRRRCAQKAASSSTDREPSRLAAAPTGPGLSA